MVLARLPNSIFQLVRSLRRNCVIFVSYLSVGLSFDSKGNLLVCDYGNMRVRHIDMLSADKTVSTLLGSGNGTNVSGVTLACSFDRPLHMQMDFVGNYYISCYNAIAKYEPATGEPFVFL
jgi:hypothetical protein